MTSSQDIRDISLGDQAGPLEILIDMKGLR